MTGPPSLKDQCREAVQRVRERLAVLAAAEQPDPHDIKGKRNQGLALAADRLGISRQAVALWKDRIPLERVYDVAKLTGIPPRELRPDLIGRRRYRAAKNGKPRET